MKPVSTTWTEGSALGVAVAYLGSIGLLWWGLLTARHAYVDPHFAVEYLRTELLVAAWLLACTLIWIKPSAIGLRLPEWRHGPGLVPLAALVGVYGAKWAYCRLVGTLAPAGADIDPLQILATTLTVGLTEEWMYRGIMLAACTAWLGLRKGMAWSLVLFGGLHWLNAAAGQSVAMVLLQSVLAALTGAVLLLAALSTRSLLLPMLGHGLYDFFTIDSARVTFTHELEVLTLLALPVGPLLGLYALLQLRRWPLQQAPYPATAPAGAQAHKG
jgi:membrane protease YdiL (CAAX protease family)